ncbi:MAG: hypothetical protein R2805_09075 [Flavobacterium sp.]|jgi:hypothetical protein|uniref:hypothetical protein n=1 Tax=Flavobacterium sp. TaxID=239 RepID=UPI002BE99A47|nr:hypothetical protein [Flavobacterium sp.]HQA74616.1 hypothetical protein [Flavobacterium sp.]
MSPEEEKIIVNMLLLQDSMKHRKDAMSKIEEMANDYDQLIQFIDDKWDDLTENEKNQVLDRYKQEREKRKS